MCCKFLLFREFWCPGAESNHRHEDFQSSALPTELSGQRSAIKRIFRRNVNLFLEKNVKNELSADNLDTLRF